MTSEKMFCNVGLLVIFDVLAQRTQDCFGQHDFLPHGENRFMFMQIMGPKSPHGVVFRGQLLLFLIIRKNNWCSGTVLALQLVQGLGKREIPALMSA